MLENAIKPTTSKIPGSPLFDAARENLNAPSEQLG
jgi:hypothetical protein